MSRGLMKTKSQKSVTRTPQKKHQRREMRQTSANGQNLPWFDQCRENPGIHPGLGIHIGGQQGFHQRFALHLRLLGRNPVKHGSPQTRSEGVTSEKQWDVLGLFWMCWAPLTC